METGSEADLADFRLSINIIIILDLIYFHLIPYLFCLDFLPTILENLTSSYKVNTAFSVIPLGGRIDEQMQGYKIIY